GKYPSRLNLGALAAAQVPPGLRPRYRPPEAAPSGRRAAQAAGPGRWAGNDTTCWNVGRFCHGRSGWPTMPRAWKARASNSGIVTLAATVAASAVHEATAVDPLLALTIAR